jgi:hypothetical protein
MIRNKHEGGYSREAYTNTEKAINNHEKSIRELNQKRGEIMDVLKDLSEESPHEASEISILADEALGEIDPELSEIQAQCDAEKKKLQKLFTDAWNDAHVIKARREAGENRIALDRVILPTIHAEILVLQSQWEKTEHKGSELMRRAEEIEREIETYQGVAISTEIGNKIIILINEFFEIKLKISEMHHVAFRPNLKKRSSDDKTLLR